jgi:hypothetical protein
MRFNPDPELGPPRLSHLTARQYVECRYLSPELFGDYFKFGFVRNPWDRMVSMYKYFGYQRICGFNEFVCRDFGKDLWRTMRWFVCPQTEYLCDENGELIVDFVGRYEALQADFHEVCRRLGLPPTDLPHVNDTRSGQARADTTIGRELRKLKSYPWWLLRGRSLARIRRPYMDYYNDESREHVSRLYRSDIERFGYSFGETEPPGRSGDLGQGNDSPRHASRAHLPA